MIHLLKCHESICVEHFIKWYNISLLSADRNLTSNVVDKLIIKHWLLKYTLAILRKWIRKHETYFIYRGLAKLETCKPLLSNHHHGWALYMLHPLFLYRLRICGGAPHREICFFHPLNYFCHTFHYGTLSSWVMLCFKWEQSVSSVHMGRRTNRASTIGVSVLWQNTP